MKIALIGPGIMPIPPNGWGAVEMLIWDYYNILTSNGCHVKIINTPNQSEIINLINNENFDVIHLHYDVFIDIIDKINCPKKIVSSHFPFINELDKHNEYSEIFKKLIKNEKYFLFASSEKDINTYVNNGAKKENTFLNRLGVKVEEYNFIDTPKYDKTLCFSQIINRKRQYVIQDFENIDFYGRLDDVNFVNKKNYHGEIPRKILNEIITNYSNFILISSTENTTPLAVKEALVCGLGVVVTPDVAYELDDLDFISVVTEDQIMNRNILSEIILKNKEISKNKRKEIREYGIKKFNLTELVLNEYLPKIKNLT